MTISENTSSTECLKKGSIGESRQNEVKSSARWVSRNWGWPCKSMKIYKSQSKRKYGPVWHQMCDRSENQMASSHLSSGMWSSSSESITRLDPQIKEAFPRRRSMMISKCRKVWAWLNGPRKTPLGDHDKITIGYQLDMHLVSDKGHVTSWRGALYTQNGISQSMKVKPLKGN